MRLKKILIGIIAAIVLITAGVCTVIGTGVLNPSEHQFTLGYKYLEEGKYEEAIIAFNKVIKIDNKKIDAYLGKAQAEIGLKDSKNALATIEKAIRIVSESNRAYSKANLAKVAEWWINNADSSDGNFEEILKLISEHCPDVVSSYEWGESEYETEKPYKEYQALYINGEKTEHKKYTGNTKPDTEAIRQKLVGTWNYQGESYAFLIDKLKFYSDGSVENSGMRHSYKGTYEIVGDDKIKMTFKDNSGYAPLTDDGGGEYDIQDFSITLSYDADTDTITVPDDSYNDFGYPEDASYKKSVSQTKPSTVSLNQKEAREKLKKWIGDLGTWVDGEENVLICDGTYKFEGKEYYQFRLRGKVDNHMTTLNWYVISKDGNEIFEGRCDNGELERW